MSTTQTLAGISDPNPGPSWQEDSDQRESRWTWKHTAITSLVAVVIFFAVRALPVPREMMGLAAYLPLHTGMEIFAVLVALQVTVICWSARRRHQPINLFLLYVPFLAVGLLDFAHFMSYADMPGLASPGTTSKAIQYWLLARIVAALALLAAALAPARAIDATWPRRIALLVMLGLVALYAWVVEFHHEWLPEVYVERVGLTPFKIMVEYAIAGMHLAAAIALLVRRGKTGLPEAQLVAIVAILALGELCFTLYVAVQDLFNILGHLYKVAGYYLLYRIVFVDAVERPIVELRRSGEEYRELAQHEDKIRENEKARIARGIHDELGSTLTAMKIQVQRLQKRSELGGEAAQTLGQMRELLDQADSAVHRVATQLRPRIIDDLGVVAALEWLAREFERNYGMPCVFSASDKDFKFNEERSIAVFRIVQEGLNNVVKHAQASEAYVELICSAEELVLRIVDNGRGLADTAARRPNGSGHGIRGMRERARILGGDLSISARDGGGTSLAIRIPLG